MKSAQKIRDFDKNAPQREKIRLVVVPFLLLTLGTIAFCTVLYGGLVRGWGMDDYKVGRGLVVIAVLAPMLIYRRLNLIHMGRWNRFFGFLCVMPILAPLFCLKSCIDEGGADNLCFALLGWGIGMGIFLAVVLFARFDEKELRRFLTGGASGSRPSRIVK
jgi:hypothetical protein